MINTSSCWGNARIMDEKIKENLKRVRENIAQAASRAKRDVSEITLVAVTKMVEADAVKLLLQENQVDFGESKSQDLLQKNDALKASVSRHLEMPDINSTRTPRSPRWHMIGHLQRNKVKQILPIVEYIHSVDSLRLAEEINTAAARLGLNDKVKIFLQVNTSQERQKFGLAVGAVSALTEQINSLPNIIVVGLMTMAPLTSDTIACRFCFSRLREIFEEIKNDNLAGPHFNQLSMGMSQDYTVAIEEGATMVRIGSALFT
jgi:PLP dependent protein